MACNMTSSPNYHRIFNVDDILERIFAADIWPDSPYAPTVDERRSLIQAALSCKAFLEPALATFWRAIWDIRPLLRLIPAVRTVDGFTVLHGDVDPSSWERFDYYARWIREFTEPPYNISRVHLALYARLARYRTPLLPALQSYATHMQGFPTAHSFFSASLTSVSIDHWQESADGEHHAMGAVFDALRVFSPGLRRFTFAWPQVAIPSIYLQTITSLLELRYVSVTIPRRHVQELLEVLAPLPHLDHLRIHDSTASRGDPIPWFPSAIISDGFPSLVHLRLESTNEYLRSATQFLTTLRPNQLTSARFQWIFLAGYRSQGMPEVYALLTQLGTRFPHSLTTLDLALRYESGHDHPPAPSSAPGMDLLAPLLPLRALETLALLEKLYPLALSDADVSALATAWPGLQVLWLGALGPARPTLAALRALAARCRRLELLALSLDARATDGASADDIVPSDALASLVVAAGSALDDPAGVARAIDAIYPCATVTLAHGLSGGAWARVSMLLSDLREAKQRGEVVSADVQEGAE